MALTLQQLRTLDALIQTGLDQTEAARRAWFDALKIDDEATRSLLQRALFPDRLAETATFLDRAPSISDASEAATDLHAGQTIGHYTLDADAPLGEGGSATVWRAHRSDGTMRRSVALKLPFYVGNPQGWYERVNRERDILASLQHPNIATIFEAGVEASGRPWLALELIDGLPIDRHCEVNALDIDARVRLVLTIARALEYSHAHGVIHRDVKPANLLVDTQGTPKLLDFGIAKLTASDSADTSATELTALHGRPFTPEYASPEQLSGAAVTTDSDVYALATVLYELIAGERPFSSTERTSERSVEHVRLRKQQIAVPPTKNRAKSSRHLLSSHNLSDLDAIVLMAIHPDARTRYGSANAFADDLERYLARKPVNAQPDSQWYRMRRFLLRNVFAVSGSAAIAVSLIAGSGIATWQALHARTQAKIAFDEAKCDKGVSAQFI
jgi:eukaryotic-like serine/threonine-protein kinase